MLEVTCDPRNGGWVDQHTESIESKMARLSLRVHASVDNWTHAVLLPPSVRGTCSPDLQIFGNVISRWAWYLPFLSA